MKGIILAGGSGKRLYPMTVCISKQMLPVYDKPMIYYPLSTLLLGGIREVLVISTPRDLPGLGMLLGDGSQWGIKLAYAEQPRPEGLAQALIIAEEFLDGDSCTLVLGDNIFFGQGFGLLLSDAIRQNRGATIFGYRVQDPRRYGVVTLNEEGVATSIVEKPETPISPWAVVGLYVYDANAVEIAKRLRPSARGELEITEVNGAYLKAARLRTVRLGRGYAWFDAGVPDSLLDAANYVATLEKRQGLKIACPEEIALRQGFVSDAQLRMLINDFYKGSDYGHYLTSIVDELSSPRADSPVMADA